MYLNNNTNITPEFASAYASAVAQTHDVVADATNPFHKNSYATLGAHIQATKGIFAQNGLAIVQFPYGNGNGVGVTTMVLHASGGFIERTCLMPVTEGLKGQDLGSLISYVRRYAIASVANLATADDDGEADRVIHATAVAPVPYKTGVFAKPAPAPAPAPVVKAPSIKPPAGDNSALAMALTFIVPFGKNKGLTLAQLPENSLMWYIKEYQPKPYKGEISEKDKAFRDSLDLIASARNGNSVKPVEPDDSDVPF